MKLLRIFKKKSQATKYYKFRNIPFKNWEMCIDGDLRYTRLNYTEGDSLINENDLNAWFDLQDSYQQLYGVKSSEVSKLLKLKCTLANLQLAYIRDSKANRILINDIRAHEEQILITENELSKGITISELKIDLSKMQGYHLPGDLLAKEFYDILKRHQNG